ncbi:DNA protecting protein DprA [Haemophilus paracuniculus]|uniref:DNA protecting protein DprA n=1 Tax=Haemophilus paracuniculus TaxID=734 RepID=A0A1T0ARK3_9PAST|nr:DNA-processing protein DprA [Haemophilus paracuniculus]OOR98977.1 DNA protecting protein DprA [Haemophilus paracuniculus]
MAYQRELLRLLQVPQFGAAKIARLLAEVDWATFCDYGKAELRAMGWNERQIQRWLKPDLASIEQTLAWAEQPNQRLLTLFDEDYPFLLRQISTAPPVLFVRGAVEALGLPQIAMVGSRDYSPYGEFWAKQFAGDLVKNGLAVTSGLAIGIDGFCHQQAVSLGGITVAVLGSGLDQVYPLRHKKLAEQISENGGALVSEFFPTQLPLAENFPRRNRIISGLSLGTLVVEATINSGSLITARYALEQGREVFALPNSVQNPYSQGCHKLIKEGALLVENVADMLDAIAPQIQTPRPSQFALFHQTETPLQAARSEPISAKPTATSPALSAQPISIPTPEAKIPPNLTACQQQIYTHISLDPISVDDIAKACDFAVETVLIEMLNLELSGVVKQVSGGYVKC